MPMRSTAVPLSLPGAPPAPGSGASGRDGLHIAGADGSTRFGTGGGNNAGTTGGTPAVGASPDAGPAYQGRRLSLADVMHGRRSPERDMSQTGARLPKYVLDAVRAVATTSQGQWSMHALVTEAVKQFLPPEALYDAWFAHGGDAPGPPGVPPPALTSDDPT